MRMGPSGTFRQESCAARPCPLNPSSCDSHGGQALLDRYFELLPQYQGVPLDALCFRCVLFGAFPTYTASPLRPQFDRILQVCILPLSVHVSRPSSLSKELCGLRMTMEEADWLNPVWPAYWGPGGRRQCEPVAAVVRRVWHHVAPPAAPGSRRGLGAGGGRAVAACARCVAGACAGLLFLFFSSRAPAAVTCVSCSAAARARCVSPARCFCFSMSSCSGDAPSTRYRSARCVARAMLSRAPAGAMRIRGATFASAVNPLTQMIMCLQGQGRLHLTACLLSSYSMTGYA